MFTNYIKDYTSIKDNYKDILNMINQYEHIIIYRHVRPDPDAYGAQLGLKEIIKNIFPNKTVSALGESEPSLDFLGTMDIAEIRDDALYIVVDTANHDRIDGDIPDGAKVIKIDHHPDHDPFGDINLVETSVSSTSELLYLIANLWGYNNDFINDEAAKLLYMGIVGDTGRFLFNNTTGMTHYVASELKQYDFDSTSLIQEMNRTSIESFRFKGHLISNFNLRPSGVLHTFVSREDLKEFGVSGNEASLSVNLYRDIDDVKIWFMAIEEEDEIRVRLRSKSVIINDVANQFGGGGHPLASGIKLNDKNEIETLVKALEDKIENN